MGLEDRLGRAVDVDPVLVDKPLQVRGVGIHGPSVVGRARRFGGVFQDRLMLLRQAVELVLVEDDLEELGRLVIAAHALDAILIAPTA